MADFYTNRIFGGGVNMGRTLLQATGEVGGIKHIFVKLQGSGKNALVYPTVGGKLANPFLGRAKAYAGDLVEYNPGITADTGATVKILKTYEVANDASDATTIEIVRNGYRHAPFIGDIIMAAPDTIDGTGTPSTVTAVSLTTSTDSDGNTINIFSVTVDTAITASAGDVLIEADSDGNPIVTNPNAVLDHDYDFFYDPSTSDDDFYGARYLITPALAGEDLKMYTAKMQPLPDTYLALNQSKVDGWFNL